MAQSFDFLTTLLLIGDTCVGKSSLLLRFAEDKFDMNYVSTIGMDYKIRTMEVDGKLVKLQVWDTAGQERFRSITAGYYRGAKGIFLVYSIVDESSFDHIEHWIRNIEEHGNKGVELLLIGNKADLENSRVVSKQRGMKLAEKYGIPFFETSAKMDYNVDNIFKTLTRNVIRKEWTPPEETLHLQDWPSETPAKGCCFSQYQSTPKLHTQLKPKETNTQTLI